MPPWVPSACAYGPKLDPSWPAGPRPDVPAAWPKPDVAACPSPDVPPIGPSAASSPPSEPSRPNVLDWLARVSTACSVDDSPPNWVCSRAISSSLSE